MKFKTTQKDLDQISDFIKRREVDRKVYEETFYVVEMSYFYIFVMLHAICIRLNLSKYKV